MGSLACVHSSEAEWDGQGQGLFAYVLNLNTDP